MATLVFGVGYIGSRLVQELLYQGREVVGLDNLFASDPRAIEGFRQSPTFRMVEGSILDAAAVERALDLAGDIDAAYLLAAQASAHPDAAPPDYTETVNLQGPRVILDGLARRGVRAPVVYASSLRVYGSPLPSVVDEQTPLGVFTDLAHLSKCYAEKLLEMYNAVRGLAGRVVRLALTYGVAPVLKMDPRFMTAPNLFCLRAARGEAVEIRTPDPLALIHVDDAARALLLAAEGVPGTGFAVFNAAGETASLRDVAACLQQVIAERAIDVDLAVRDLTDGRPAGPAPAVRSALRPYGFRPTRQLGEGLAETFDHFWVHGR